MSANNYDLLNVDESASADEIRAAWKTAIADLDPTERRFRAYNDAAGVLLDPDKRAAYDARLVEERAEEEAEEDPADAPDDVVVQPDTQADARSATKADDKAGPKADDKADTKVAATKPASTKPASTKPAADATAPSAGPGRPVLWAVGLAAVLAIALAIWIFTLPGVRADESPNALSDRSVAQQKAALSVEGAAEQLVTPVLSYNFKTMAADLERVKGYVTPRMAATQSKAWPEITAEAEEQQIVVEASATGVALTRVDPNGKRATVVVFVDQSVVKKGAQPFVLKMWATLKMVKESGGQGRWLLDDLCTDDRCA